MIIYLIKFASAETADATYVKAAAPKTFFIAGISLSSKKLFCVNNFIARREALNSTGNVTN